jgi:probable phosphoglycerate mutase
MHLYFVRHGESEANTRHIISNRESPFPLTPRGRGQAEALAESLRGTPVSAIYSSPLLRARDTAAILCAAFGLSYRVTEALREYDCGILEEKGDVESWGFYRQYFEDWVLRGQYTNKPEDGECFLDIQDRFVPFIESLVENSSPAENILLVGHGGLFLLMLPLVMTNIDHSFSTSHALGNTDYALAQQTSGGLVCLQWGQHILVKPSASSQS